MYKRSLLFLMIIGLFLSVSATALALETEDTISPEITIISPVQYQAFTAGGPISIDYTVKDNDGGSGIRESWWNMVGMRGSGLSYSQPTYISLDSDIYKFIVTAIDYSGNITITEEIYIHVYESYSQGFTFYGWLSDWPLKDKSFIELQYKPESVNCEMLKFRNQARDINFISEGFDWVGELYGQCAVQAHGRLQGKPGSYTILVSYNLFGISKQNWRILLWSGSDTSNEPIAVFDPVFYYRGNEGENQNYNDYRAPM